jgi:hypothetical protein
MRNAASILRCWEKNKQKWYFKCWKLSTQQIEGKKNTQWKLSPRDKVEETISEIEDQVEEIVCTDSNEKKA